MKSLFTALMLLTSLTSFASLNTALENAIVSNDGSVDQPAANKILKALKNQVDNKYLVCPRRDNDDIYGPTVFLSSLVLQSGSLVSITEAAIKVTLDSSDYHWVVNFSISPDQKVITKISYSYRQTEAGEDNLGTLLNPVFVPSEIVKRKLDVDCNLL